MGENIGQKFIYNNTMLDQTEFDVCYRNLSPSLYEVIRIMDGIPLFFEEHFQRLLHSAHLLNHTLSLDANMLRQTIVRLVESNGIENNNIKIVINNLTKEGYNLYIFLIHSNYPNPLLYKDGVTASTFRATRSIPNAKVIHQDLRERINQLLREQNKYEALLVNEKDCVTEGSRSNLFLIKAGKLYTAPADDVLIGITRKKIISLCTTNGIEVIEAPIPVKSLGSFEACFISGTSPRILPLNRIDDLLYQLDNKTLHTVIKLYDEDIQCYLSSHRQI